jgi:hypothetical protein
MSNPQLHSPIFVTGIERSGSSIVGRIINLSGAWAGNITDMYENIQIKKLLDAYYELLGVDKRGQYPLPDTGKLIIPTNWGDKVESIVATEMRKDKPWMLKGSRLCQTWPVWHYAFPNAKWVIVRRRPGDIIDSCLKTGYINAYKDKQGWLDWIHLHENIFVEMIQAGLNCKQVWPERIAAGDYLQIREMVEWVGLEWDYNIKEAIDPLMWKSKQRKGKE